MQITEMLNQGLRRKIKVVVSAEDMDAKLTERLDSVKDKIRLKGFRPGKIPITHLRKVHGKALMVEVINEILREIPRFVLAERGEYSVAQPEIEIGENKKEAKQLLDGKTDFIFSLNYEVLPKFDLKDVSVIEVTREIVSVSENEVNEQIKRLLSSNRTYTEKEGKAEDGDKVTIDYFGKLGDKPFKGGAGNDVHFILGTKKFPNFEEKLIGAKAGDRTNIKVFFPEDYEAFDIAGKEANFDIKIKKVSTPDELKIDDEAAKRLGMESLSHLWEVVREQIENQYAAIARQKMKRQILDTLDKDYQFDIPEQLVEVEFNNIWKQLNADLKQEGYSFEDKGMTEEDTRKDYRRLAERRVRLGLIFSKISEEVGVTVDDKQLQHAVYEQARQYPKQEKKILDFFRRTPRAMANLYTSISEEKVFDHLFGKITITNKQVTLEELLDEK
ncbi:MAG: trigger factor [Candidatus Tokpelaia sp. JSC188]|nr:MAG: trigger factor [Candidatus Tokpelaia sp. JSC188]